MCGMQEYVGSTVFRKKLEGLIKALGVACPRFLFERFAWTMACKLSGYLKEPIANLHS